MLKRWYVIAGITVGALAACLLLLMVGAAVGGIAGYTVGHRGLAIRVPEAWQKLVPELGPWQEVPEPQPQVPELWQMLPGIRLGPFSGQLRGALIVEIDEGGPADQAGVETGDIVIAVDSKAIDEDHDLPDLILSHHPGDDVTLTIVRRDDEAEVVELEITLGSETNEEGGVAAHLGVRYRSVMSGFGLAPLERAPRLGRDTQPD